MFANWWAIQQVLALTHPERHKRWLTVSYEKLYLEPETELARIADWTGMKLPPDWKARINRPSQTTLGNVTEQSMRPELNTWKESLKRDQIKIILDIVHAYGINIYTDAAEPDYTNLYPLNAYEKKH
jgi:hypothetical protein